MDLTDVIIRTIKNSGICDTLYQDYKYAVADWGTGLEGTTIMRETIVYYHARDCHIHVGIFEPTPLPTIEEAAIMHIKAHNNWRDDTYEALVAAVQRKLAKND